MGSNVNKSDLFEQIMDHGVDMRSRIVYCDDAVDEKLRKRVVRGLKLLDRTEGKITVVVSCEGGIVDDGMAIYDAIRACRNEVHVEVLGIAASMGSVIMQAGDKVIMGANSKIMIHLGTFAMDSDHHINAKNSLEDNDRHNEWMIDLFIGKIKQKKPRYTRKQFEEEIKFDRYIYAEEALKLGLIDDII
jgi:ATP-dependent Clp protease protease subunit